jgi:hexosaminidase
MEMRDDAVCTLNINTWCEPLDTSASTAELADYFQARVSQVFHTGNPDVDMLPAWIPSQLEIGIDPTLKDSLPPEGYVLEVFMQDANNGIIRVRGIDRAGLFYGIQTFLQLLPPKALSPALDTTAISSVDIPCGRIVDYPRYKYRGMHLDVARTFIPKEDVMRYIDHIAHHKLNRLHWHLADDEGWRIEIKSHPELATIGGFRGGDSPVKPAWGAMDRKHGGYYTQDEIREIVEYAAFRNVTIIPEIDLPGHSGAIAALHPEILCPEPTPADTTIKRNVWCVCREENYDLLRDILKEVCALFPSEYIHVGGDEVAPEQWRACPLCSKLIKQNDWQPAALNTHFMNRINTILTDLGKKQAVWNEAINGGRLPDDVVVYAWENTAAIDSALAAGYRTVAMPAQYFYFDMRQSKDEPGFKWAGIFDLSKPYSFGMDTATAADADKICGVEGAFWTELLINHAPNQRDYMDYQTYPRICALSEVAWTQASLRDWNDFRRRMEQAHFSRLDAMGIKYRNKLP